MLRHHAAPKQSSESYWPIGVFAAGGELGFQGGTYVWALLLGAEVRVPSENSFEDVLCHQPLRPWAIQTLRTVLDQLDGGVLRSTAHYATAVARAFPI